MSIACCSKCGGFVDTDEWPQAFIDADDAEEYAELKPWVGKLLCDGCRDDLWSEHRSAE